MKNPTCWFRRWGLLLSLVWALGLAAGCDDSTYDHEPPAGQGALIVDNFTGDRVFVYVDGKAADNVKSGKDRAYDLRPGLYRVVLDGDDVERSWAGDVDILEGRLTVMEVGDDGYYSGDFNVNVFFD
jgi:hypothetical protein